jgi:hypothetical protein
MWKRLRESFKYEDTGQYRRIRFAGFKLEHDGLWWYFAKRSVKAEKDIAVWAEAIAEQVAKELNEQHTQS